MTLWEDVARSGAGDDYAQRYAVRFRRLADSGADVHGEADFAELLVPPPARVLDAGCGTGRVGVRLDERGYDVVGVDADPTMIAVARSEAPGLDWHVADLAGLDLGERWDMVLLVGNVVPFLEPGTLEAACRGLAAHVTAEGVVVCGFGTDAAHLPAGCPVTSTETFLAAATASGLVERERWGSWARDPWTPEGGYLVTVLTPAPAGLVG